MPFYEDKQVNPKTTYLYTLVAYNSKGEYSYPIESIISYDPSATPFPVSICQEYQNNPEVLQLLKEFYKAYENESKIAEMETLMRIRCLSVIR